MLTKQKNVGLCLLLVVVCLFACQSNSFVPSSKGLVIVFECKYTRDKTMSITENEIDSVNWDKQIYYLKSDTVAGISIKELEIYLCTSACQIGFYIDQKMQTQIPIWGAIAPINLPRKGKKYLFCSCSNRYDCLFDDCALNLRQQDDPSIDVLGLNEQIKQRLLKIGKLR